MSCLRVVWIIIVRIIPMIIIIITRPDQSTIEFGLKMTIHSGIDGHSEMNQGLCLEQIRLHIRHPVKSASIWEDVSITWELWTRPFMKRDDDGKVCEDESGHAPWIRSYDRLAGV